MSNTLDVSPAIQNSSKSKDRNSCSTSFSDDSNEIEDRFSNCDVDFENSNCSRNTYFQPEITQLEITPKLHKRAVHVLFSLCWDRDISQDTLWTALMIFYSFKAKRIIKKIDLEKIVSVCVLLSCKLLQPEKISLKDLIQITNGKYSAKQISQTEEEILETLNFDLYIENSMMEVGSIFGLDQIELQEFYCLAEMLMLKGSQVFWKRTVLYSLVKMIRGVSDENCSEVKVELMELCKSREGEFILRKYSSMMDTQKLVQKVQKH